jgi:hypothetical protein
MKAKLLAMGCGALLALGGTAFAAEPIPADPDGRFNQMMTDCMTRQDPALNKDDALELCRKKMKQGIPIDTPKEKKKDKGRDKPRDKPDETPQKS